MKRRLFMSGLLNLSASAGRHDKACSLISMSTARYMDRCRDSLRREERSSILRCRTRLPGAAKKRKSKSSTVSSISSITVWRRAEISRGGLRVRRRAATLLERRMSRRIRIGGKDVKRRTYGGARRHQQADRERRRDRHRASFGEPLRI